MAAGGGGVELARKVEGHMNTQILNVAVRPYHAGPQQAFTLILSHFLVVGDDSLERPVGREVEPVLHLLAGELTVTQFRIGGDQEIAHDPVDQ